MGSPSATLGPCSSCRRMSQSRLFIVNPVAGSPGSRSALLSIVDSNVFNLVPMVSIWMWVLYCSRMLKCWSFDLLKVSERSLLGEVNLLEFALSGSKWSASGEVRFSARKSALAWGEDRSSSWSPKSKSESPTSLADSAVRNSSSVLGFFAGEDSLVVARWCLISSSSSGVRVSMVVGDVVDAAWGGWGGEASGSSWHETWGMQYQLAWQHWWLCGKSQSSCQMHTYIYIYIYISLSIYISLYISLSLYIYMYIYIHIYKYIYIYM